MTNNNRKVRLESVDHLLFDPKNPRLPSTVDSSSESEVLEWMLKRGSVIELMGSIGEHGYFSGEPLLVVPVKGKPNSYHVIEGNRRLAALKLLRNPELATVRKKAVAEISGAADNKPDQAPVLEFDKRDDILYFMGYRHITGIKPWGSLAKAKYLEQLRVHDPTMSFQELAKSIGSRADYVARLLAGLAVHREIVENDYFGKDIPNEEAINFSVLTTALNYSGIANFLGLESGRDPTLKNLKRRRLSELAGWLFEKDPSGRTRVGESRNVRELSAVVENEKALDAFRAHLPLSDAFMLTDQPANIFKNSILQSREYLQSAQSHLYLVEAPTKEDDEILKEIQTLAKDLRLLVSQRLIDSEDA
jgi:hypothetical protein